MTLRPYQLDTRNLIYGGLKRHQSLLCVSPTGSGKGYLLGHICNQIADAGRKVMCVVNRRVIVFQLQRECHAHGVTTGLIMGTEEKDEDSPVQIASIATLKRRNWLDLPEVDWVIVDEAHREPESYKELVRRARQKNQRTKLLGLTATPLGPNGTRLDGYDVQIEPVKNSWLVNERFLLPTVVRSLEEPDMTGQCTVLGNVFKELEPYRGLPTICFLPRVAYAHGFAAQAEARGYKCHVIDASTGKTERSETFQAFKENDADMLISVDVLREGFDAPNACVGVDLQPTHQLRVHWQKIGRIKRPYKGQDNAVLLDFAGNVWRDFPHPDDDVEWDQIVGGKSAEDYLAERAGKRCPECGSRNIWKNKCEDCGTKVVPKKKPWVCPKCSQQLAPWQSLKDKVCPNCGAKVGKAVRRIRMQNGSLKTIPAEEVRKRLKKHSNADQAEWDKWRYIAHGWNKKNAADIAAKKVRAKDLQWCKIMFKQKQGHWPNGLKSCPEIDSADWRRTPGDVFPWMK